MRRANTSSKAKSTDLQAANASTDASNNSANGANNPPSAQTAPPDKTYAMCKELCREMSESVLRGINERFDAFEASFQSLVTSQADLQARMVNQEQTASDFEARIQELEANYTALTKQNNKLQTKLLDLEARSRRQNIKIVGIREDEEQGKPTEFVSGLIPKLLGEEHFPHPVKVDRAHRSLQPKPAAGAQPRTILARIHHFQVKELILRRSRQQPMEYKGKKVLIFPDYTSEVMAQRRAFRDVQQALRDRGIKHSLRYPARLHVHRQDGEAPTVFSDPKEAAAFLERSNARTGE